MDACNKMTHVVDTYWDVTFCLFLDGEHFFIGAETKLHKVAPAEWKERSKKGHRQPATFVTYFRVKFYVGSVNLMRYIQHWF